MAVTNTELDPQFLKALGYLTSKSPDSTAKLKKMLDDAIEQSVKKKQEAKIGLDKSAVGMKSKHLAKITKSGSCHDLKRKEKDLAQKRQFEKIQKDLEELDQEVSKKSRLDRSSSPMAMTALFSGDSKLRSDSSDSPLASSDSNKDFALEMDDLACAICKGFAPDKGAPVECQECHNMYHRECHQPPISHQDTNDPRCVWYCSRCTKNMKKVAKQINSKPSTASSNPVRDRINSLESKNKSAFVTPFKRNEMKATLQSSSGNGSSGGSLAGWAALSGKSIQSSSTTSKPTTSKPLAMAPSLSTQKSSTSQSKEKRDKSSKASKHGPKLAVCDAFAEALGAELPPAQLGSSKTSHKSSSKSSSSSWSNKSSMFPKASASTGTSATKASAPPGANAEKRLQMLKKKAKMNPKKSKI